MKRGSRRSVSSRACCDALYSNDCRPAGRRASRQLFVQCSSSGGRRADRCYARGVALSAVGAGGGGDGWWWMLRREGSTIDDDKKREEQERQRDQMRHREPERPRDQERRKERDNVEPERRRRGGGSNDDEPPVDRQRDPYAEPDRGLGFAFEGDNQKPRDPAASAGAQQDMPPPQPPRPGPERDYERSYDAKPHVASQPPPADDADQDYRRRMEQVQRELGLPAQDPSSDSDPDRERRRREREARQAERQGRKMNGHQNEAPNYYDQPAPPPSAGLRGSFEDDASQVPSQSTWSSAPTTNGQSELRRRPSILDSSMDPGLMAQVIDNSQSEKRENRVRIVDPPSDEEDKRPKGILKKPTSKFPEDPNAVREGVAPLKDVCHLCFHNEVTHRANLLTSNP